MTGVGSGCIASLLYVLSPIRHLFRRLVGGSASDGHVYCVPPTGQGSSEVPMRYIPARRRSQRSAPRRRSRTFALRVRESPIPTTYAIPAPVPIPRKPRTDHRTAPYEYSTQSQDRRSETLATTRATGKKPRTLARFRIRVATERSLMGFFGKMALRCGTENVDTERVGKGVASVLMDHDLGKPVGRIASMDCKDGEVYAIVEIADMPRSRELLAEIRAGGVREGISPGFLIDKSKPSKDPGAGTYDVDITRWAPYEVSFVVAARNPDARIMEEL